MRFERQTPGRFQLANGRDLCEGHEHMLLPTARQKTRSSEGKLVPAVLIMEDQRLAESGDIIGDAVNTNEDAVHFDGCLFHRRLNRGAGGKPQPSPHFSLRFFNALNGAPVRGAKVRAAAYFSLAPIRRRRFFAANWLRVFEGG
jgi:hypothetical protein